MTKEEIIEGLEKNIRDIFNKDIITDLDVLIANSHFKTWKKLTDYKCSEGPVIKIEKYNVLDKYPRWRNKWRKI